MTQMMQRPLPHFKDSEGRMTQMMQRPLLSILMVNKKDFRGVPKDGKAYKEAVKVSGS